MTYSGYSIQGATGPVSLPGETPDSGAAYLDVLDSFFNLVSSEVVVGHQVLALFDGLLQVGSSSAHLVFEGFVLTQQPHCSSQVLPIILGGQDLLLLPDPSLLQTTDTFRRQLHKHRTISGLSVFNSDKRESPVVQSSISVQQ